MTSSQPFGASAVGTGKLYGAMWADADGTSHLSLGNKGAQRVKLDTAWLFMIVLGPVALFGFLFWMESFRFHYDQPTLIWLVVLLCLAPAVFFGYLSFTSRSSDWSKFLTQTFFLAWLLALVCGSMNYSGNLMHYYQIINLNSYVQVDPTTAGASAADAGQILFQNNAALDLSKAMSVRVGKTFCVTPFSMPNATSNVSYDYWAVGVDCCSSTQPQAENTCPGTPYTRPITTGALRLMDVTNRAYFRMAVQQAEATYKIVVPSPIFLTFTEDPFATINTWFDDGNRTFFRGVASFFCLQVFLVMTAFFCFGSVGLRSHESEYGLYKTVQQEYPEGIGKHHLKALEDEAAEALTL